MHTGVPQRTLMRTSQVVNECSAGGSLLWESVRACATACAAAHTHRGMQHAVGACAHMPHDSHVPNECHAEGWGEGRSSCVCFFFLRGEEVHIACIAWGMVARLTQLRHSMDGACRPSPGTCCNLSGHVHACTHSFCAPWLRAPYPLTTPALSACTAGLWGSAAGLACLALGIL